MICLECKQLDIKANPQHAKRGLGRCKHENLPGVFVSFSARKECAQFVAAPESQANERKAWWAKQVEKESAELAETMREEKKWATKR